MKEATKNVDRNDNNEMDLAEFTKLYPNCFSSKRHFIGDDWCDDENNNGDIYVLKGKREIFYPCSGRVLVFPSVLFSFVLVFCKKKQKVFFQKPSVLD